MQETIPESERVEPSRSWALEERIFGHFNSGKQFDGVRGSFFWGLYPLLVGGCIHQLKKYVCQIGSAPEVRGSQNT